MWWNGQKHGAKTKDSGAAAGAEEEAEEARSRFFGDCGGGLRGEALLGVECCLDAGIEAERGGRRLGGAGSERLHGRARRLWRGQGGLRGRSGDCGCLGPGYGV